MPAASTSRHASLLDKSNASLFQLKIDALSLVNTKTKTKGGDGDGTVGEESASGRDNVGMEFDAQDYELVREVFGFGKAILKLLVHSLCPTIYGHEMVKAGLLLGLFGGSGNRAAADADVAVRGDPHVRERPRGIISKESYSNAIGRVPQEE